MANLKIIIFVVFEFFRYKKSDSYFLKSIFRSVSPPSNIVTWHKVDILLNNLEHKTNNSNIRPKLYVNVMTK